MVISAIGLTLALAAAPSLCPTGLASPVELRADGLFQFGQPWELTPSVTLADADGDGDLDGFAAVGRHWAQNSKVYLNHGGLFRAYRPIDGLEGATAYEVGVGDFDGDGDIDAATVRDGVPGTLALNDGQGQFTDVRAFGPAVGARGAAVGDINGDGYADLVVSVREDGRSFVAYGSASKPFDRIVPLAEEAPTVGVALGDLDGDGDLDAVFGQRGGDGGVRVVWNQNGRLSAFQPLSTFSGDTRSVVIADFDGNGDLDVAGAVGDQITILQNVRGRFQAGASLRIEGGQIYGLAASDIDRDGRMDIALARVENSNSILFQTTDCWNLVTIPEPVSDTYGVAIGDLDGNGYPDIVFANSEARNDIVYVRPLPSE